MQPSRKEVAHQIVTLISPEGSELDRAFEGTGLVVEGQIDVCKLEHIFADHCGHLPNSSWLRHRRRSCEDVPSLMCTCCHLSCEHLLYAICSSAAEGPWGQSAERPRASEARAQAKDGVRRPAGKQEADEVSDQDVGEESQA